VRVNAQLIDAHNDAHLWANTYDRDLADVFAIQSEISKTIADQLQAKLWPEEKSAIEPAPTKDDAAFDLYTRARNLFLSAWSSDTGRADMLRGKEEALREGRRAVELLPLEKDEHGGIAMVKYLSITAAWVGDKELALEQLRIATSHPCDLSDGQLKLLPFWDALHGDPGFEQIVASLAPKNTDK
jgi:hypothetical protein